MATVERTTPISMLRSAYYASAALKTPHGRCGACAGALNPARVCRRCHPELVAAPPAEKAEAGPAPRVEDETDIPPPPPESKAHLCPRCGQILNAAGRCVNCPPRSSPRNERPFVAPASAQAPAQPTATPLPNVRYCHRCNQPLHKNGRCYPCTGSFRRNYNGVAAAKASKSQPTTPTPSPSASTSEEPAVIQPEPAPPLPPPVIEVERAEHEPSPPARKVRTTFRTSSVSREDAEAIADCLDMGFKPVAAVYSTPGLPRRDDPSPATLPSDSSLSFRPPVAFAGLTEELDIINACAISLRALDRTQRPRVLRYLASLLDVDLVVVGKGGAS